MDCFVRIVHDDIRQFTIDIKRQFQLFHAFPDDTVLSGLIGLDLSTGKFPEKRTILSFRSLTDQKPVIPLDDSSGYFQQC